MERIRIGVVGIGMMGSGLLKGMVDEKSPEFAVTAVCDIDAERAAKFGQEYGLPHFTDAYAMYASGLIDAVYIATPHYWHAPLAIKAAQCGLHVLCEKPISVTVGAARAMVEECRKHKVALGVMFMMRTRGLMKRMHEMIAAGELGDIFRISMIGSCWFRSQYYYDSGKWRGTWDGEGGGVLMNQAPHSLDLFQWLGGLPKTVTASVATRGHRIEVEDTVNVVCDYGDGRTGYIYATTSEAPGTEQFIVAGEKGTLVAEGGVLRFGKLQTPVLEYQQTAKDMYGGPKCEWQEIKFETFRDGWHINVVNAWVKHILHGEPMICSGEEALNELELCNAIYLSGFTGKRIALPVDAAAIERLITKLERERSSGRGGNLRRAAKMELARLLRK